MSARGKYGDIIGISFRLGARNENGSLDAMTIEQCKQPLAPTA